MAVTFCGRVVAIVGGHANLGLAAAVGERVRARAFAFALLVHIGVSLDLNLLVYLQACNLPNFFLPLSGQRVRSTGS